MAAELRTHAPALPPAVAAFLHDEWAVLDPEAPLMLGWMQKQRAFREFAHARSPFDQHLRSTWAMLCCWGQPRAISRCGLFHSAYSGQVFYWRFFDLTSDESRERLRAVVGPAAEQEVYNFCSTHRQEAMPLSDYGDVDQYAEAGPGSVVQPLLKLGDPIDPAGYTLPCRHDPSQHEHLSAEELARILVVLVADVAEQLTGVFTYLDVYPLESEEAKSWPGDGSPGIGLSAFSLAMGGKGIKCRPPCTCSKL
jgi:hypothetical protein